MTLHMHPFTRRLTRGFTLVELLVVILIIGLLTGIVAPRLLSQVGKSETTAALAQMSAFEKALQAYRIDTGSFPSTAQGLNALVRRPGDMTRWQGPYMQDEIPKDPWGTPYQYISPAANGKDYEIRSLGRDRTPGGHGDDADLIRQ